MPKYTLTITEKQRDQARALATAEDRSLRSMLEAIFARGLHVSIPAAKTTVETTAKTTVETTVDPAVDSAGTEVALSPEDRQTNKETNTARVRAHGQAAQQSLLISDDDDETRIITEGVRMLTSEDWHGAAHAKTKTPEEVIRRLHRTYTDISVLEILGDMLLWIDKGKRFKSIEGTFRTFVNNHRRDVATGRKAAHSRGDNGTCPDQQPNGNGTKPPPTNGDERLPPYWAQPARKNGSNRKS